MNKRVFDCIIFYNEINLLLIRLHYMSAYVDKFIIVESAEGFTRKPKPLYFQENRELFKEFEDKIIYCTIDEYSSNDPWENEFYSRNYFHNILNKIASNDDIVILSDVDEIMNLKSIFELYSIDRPHFVRMFCYYGFLNVRSSEVIEISMISPYGDVKDKHWGHRYNMRDNIANRVIVDNDRVFTGGHYTYQYGNLIEMYVDKLNNFAHQELNTIYMKDRNRIKFCLKYKYDLFNRDWVMHEVDIQKIFDSKFLYLLQSNDQLKGLLYTKPSICDAITKYFSPYFFDRFLRIFRKRIGKLFPFLGRIKKLFK